MYVNYVIHKKNVTNEQILFNVFYHIWYNQIHRAVTIGFSSLCGVVFF